jgi:hypothetical protein
VSVSDPKQDLGPSNPLYYAPRRSHERNNRIDPEPAEHGNDQKGSLAPRTLNDDVAQLRPFRGKNLRRQDPSDIFAEALARIKQQQLEPELVEAPNYRSIGAVAKLAIAAAAAALIALACVVALPTSQSLIGDGAWSALPTWQAARSYLFPASPHRPAPTLIVRDNSGPINEPLGLGISVDAPAPGTTVTINRVTPGARLTAGRRMNASEWRVPAQEISDAAIIPPTDFVGEMNLSVELRGTDGATLVAAFDRLTWTAPAPTSTAVAFASPTTVPPPAPIAPAPQQPQAMASLPPTAAVATPQARAEPARELSPNEIAGFVRRAQELLANGDLQGARAFLLRAAEARDARAALFLAKTFDPMVSRQFGAADPGQDLAQARIWYQRARDWGSPEAQRQLDALASYPRR